MALNMDGGSPQIAGRIRAAKNLILEAWIDRVRAQIPAAKGYDAVTLRDSIPELMDTVAEAVDGREPTLLIAQHDRAVAAKHGLERAGLAAYALEDMLDEYQLLRQVLLGVLEDTAPLAPAERNVILDVLQVAIRNAAGEFSRSRGMAGAIAQAELLRSHQALDQEVRVRTAELSRSEERFKRLVEQVKDYAIFTLDPNGVIASWNAGAHRMKGYTPQEAIGSHFSMLYPPDGNARNEPTEHLDTARKDGRFRGEGLRMRKNGELFLADVLITPMYDGDRLLGFSKVVQDLSERNLLIQERDLSRTTAERLKVEAAYRERFVATLTHDLRSPLSAAKAGAAMIARAAEKTDQVRKWAHRISDSVDRTDRMISDLLDANRLQAGEPLPLTFEDCDLTEVVQAACDELSTQSGDRFVVKAEGPMRGHWSKQGLRRVADNLLANAIKYGEPGAPITATIKRLGDTVLLAVHNRGSLISPEDQAKLFNAYHRTAEARSGGQAGWGLGLTLVRGIVDAHGGMAKVESYPVEGTTFTVHLPVDPRTAVLPTVS